MCLTLVLTNGSFFYQIMQESWYTDPNDPFMKILSIFLYICLRYVLYVLIFITDGYPLFLNKLEGGNTPLKPRPS
jgi:hypothetical protein